MHQGVTSRFPIRRELQPCLNASPARPGALIGKASADPAPQTLSESVPQTDEMYCRTEKPGAGADSGSGTGRRLLGIVKEPFNESLDLACFTRARARARARARFLLESFGIQEMRLIRKQFYCSRPLRISGTRPGKCGHSRGSWIERFWRRLPVVLKLEVAGCPNDHQSL